MKVIIEGRVYDSRHTPITLAWDTDEERQNMGEEIYNMDDKAGPRFLISCPPGTHNPNEALTEANEAYKNHIKEPVTMTW